MKYKTKLLALLAALGLLSGCGGAVSSVESVPQAAPAEFGAEIPAAIETPSAATEAPAPEAAPAATAPPLQEETTEQEVRMDLTEDAILSAVYAVYEGFAYEPEDPMYFWRSVGYLLLLAGESAPGASVEDGALRLPAEDLPIFVTALFGPYEAQYPSLGEENPLVSWESTADGEFYLVPQRSLPDLALALSPERDDPAWTAEWFTAEAVLTVDGAEAAYEVSLAEFPRGEAGERLFSCCVTGVAESGAD